MRLLGENSSLTVYSERVIQRNLSISSRQTSRILYELSIDSSVQSFSPQTFTNMRYSVTPSVGHFQNIWSLYEMYQTEKVATVLYSKLKSFSTNSKKVIIKTFVPFFHDTFFPFYIVNYNFNRKQLFPKKRKKKNKRRRKLKFLL